MLRSHQIVLLVFFLQQFLSETVLIQTLIYTIQRSYNLCKNSIISIPKENIFT